MILLKIFLLFCGFALTKAKYDPTWESLDTRPVPEWFDKAKIGIFIHWGVFSVPSINTEWFWTFWNDKEDVKDYLTNYFPPGFTYQEFAKDFTAELFKPDEWAELFVKAGAKYVILTTKHHEGFTLWPSKYSYSWNSVDIGPHRDIVGELGEAVRARNLTYGLYHSLMEWYNPLYLAAKDDWTDRRFADTKAIPELYELVNQYEPSIIWSDGDWEAPDTYWNSTDFVAWLYNESPVKDYVATNDRWGTGLPCNHGGYFTCSDRYSPTELQERKWENAMSLDKKSYGYRRDARYTDYLTIKELLTSVIQTIAYGGNILINIGPAHDGTISMLFQDRLLQLGNWLSINGEAIYESQPWQLAQKDELNDQIYYTTRNGNYYALFLDWPRGDSLNKLKLKSIVNVFDAGSNATINLLGYDSDLTWKIDESLEIDLPDLADIDSKDAWVLRIKLD